MTHHIQGNPYKSISKLVCWNLVGQERMEQYIQSAKSRGGGGDCQLRLSYPLKISIRHEGEIKTFLDKQKLRELIIPRPA